jgi:hypothetical protein
LPEISARMVVILVDVFLGAVAAVRTRWHAPGGKVS